MIIEQARLKAARENQEPWRKWGPYLQLGPQGTVVEDEERLFGGDPLARPDEHAHGRQRRSGRGTRVRCGSGEAR
jgi:hypothetical protein